MVVPYGGTDRRPRRLAMKIGITSALSAAGVLAAGFAAFTLNSAVLAGPGTGISDDAARAATLGTAPTAAPPGTATSAGNVSAASPGTPVTASSVAVSGTVTSYTVGTAGTVVVDSSGGAINVTDVVPAAGWVSEPARTSPDGTVKVHFTRGPERIEFHASLTGGKVTVSVVNETPQQPSVTTVPVPGQGSIPAAGSGTKPSVPWGGGDDDDDEDDHEDDEDDDHGPGHHDEDEDDD